ncbi:MAG: cellulase family glycosylhydrolase, partial [Dehalococcoidia bacterium]|nr:cellulase family glycosylhydrolase [Dehalococcoidia bacterium]
MLKPSRISRSGPWRFLAWLGLVAIISPLLLSCGGGPQAKPPLDKMSSPDYAVQAVVWGQYDTTERDLRLAKDAGFRWVKLMFQWDYIEVKGKGLFEWNEPDRLVKLTSELGLKLLARVDFVPKWARAPGADLKVNGPPAKYEDFFEFVGALAKRYKGKIGAYQIWNEPNLAREWDGRAPNAKEYVALLKGAYLAINAADPGAIVITSGLSPTTAPPPVAVPDIDYLRQMYAAGAKDYFDMLGVHAAGYKAPPEADPAEVAKDKALTNNDPSPENLKRTYSFRHVEDYRKVMEENGDKEKRVAILEFGWTS